MSTKNEHYLSCGGDILRRKATKAKRRERCFVYCLVIIPIIHFVVFYIGVNLNSILMSFTYQGELSGHFFERAFHEIFRNHSADNKLVEGIINSLTIFGMSIVVIFPLSVMFSFLLYKKIWGYKYFRIVFFLPSIISAVVLVALYTNVLEHAVGYTWMKLFHLSSRPDFFDTDHAFKSVLGYLLWLGIAANMIIYSGAFSRIPTEVLESGKIDGAGFFRELWYLILPLIWPTLSVVLLLAVVGIFNSDGPTLLMTQGQNGTYTLPYWIFSQTQGASPDYNYGAAVGFIFTVISIPIMFVSRWALNKMDKDVEY